MGLSALKHQALYILRILVFFPITLVKRVILGKDPIWKKFFFQSWGFYSDSARKILNSKPNLWINSEAGGELTQIFSFCQQLKEQFPEYNLVVSTHKYDAYLLAKTIRGVDVTLFSPWDFWFTVNRALRQINPRLLIVIEIPTAPVLVNQAQAKGIRTVLCSGFLSKGIDQQPILARPMSLGCYHSFDWIGAKYEWDAQGYKSIDFPESRIEVLGDMKFDSQHMGLSEEQKKSLETELGLDSGTPLIVAGSLHHGEERIVTEAYIQARERYPELRLLIAPRFDIWVSKVEQYLDEVGIPHIRRTRISASANEQNPVILLDTFGELSRIYGLAFCCVIGASLCPAEPLGGHNIVEPLVQGTPFFHGTHMEKYSEIVKELATVWPGAQISSAEELARGIFELMEDPGLCDKIKQKYKEEAAKGEKSIESHVMFIKRILSRDNSA